ncbi:MAG: DUF1622 domain-containing protein [Actinobacteria bacterium]|nr:DUF1622 domain-containing protein [Actinomycetota bacterium]
MELTNTIVRYADLLSVALALFGVFVVTVAGLQALFRYIQQLVSSITGAREVGYEYIRQYFGLKILLGLEFFVAADIVRTIVTPSFSELGKLAAIVSIRIALSYFLGREIKGLGKG